MINAPLLIYQTSDGTNKIDVYLKEETVWLTLDHMAELFGKAKSTINEHIKNIFTEGELVESKVMKKFGISELLDSRLNSDRVQYAEKLIEKLSQSLKDIPRTQKRKLNRYRLFYITYPQIRETVPHLKSLINSQLLNMKAKQ